MVKPRLTQHRSELFELPFWRCAGDDTLGEGKTPYQAFTDWAVRRHTYRSIPRVCNNGESLVGHISIKHARRYMHYTSDFPSIYAYHEGRWYLIVGYKSATDEIIIRG